MKNRKTLITLLTLTALALATATMPVAAETGGLKSPAKSALKSATAPKAKKGVTFNLLTMILSAKLMFSCNTIFRLK